MRISLHDPVLASFIESISNTGIIVTYLDDKRIVSMYQQEFLLGIMNHEPHVCAQKLEFAGRRTSR
ncbi:MAG: hypothetical protein LAP38_28720 [Acidobacteriia bacterium]|nr:hypothetical protein [Terriglobia bacterium]